MLLTEFQSKQLFTSEVSPQYVLIRCWLTTKLLTEFFVVWIV